eukprot:GHVU01211423.1.p3 GENE.GHVU01211423.1~~GHVU01211423.1.p3  ORF type:complete len:105 (+),score=5.89 GHVU01211423.1:1200-1514(+)
MAADAWVYVYVCVQINVVQKGFLVPLEIESPNRASGPGRFLAESRKAWLIRSRIRIKRERDSKKSADKPNLNYSRYDHMHVLLLLYLREQEKNINGARQLKQSS